MGVTLGLQSGADAEVKAGHGAPRRGGVNAVDSIGLDAEDSPFVGLDRREIGLDIAQAALNHEDALVVGQHSVGPALPRREAVVVGDANCGIYRHNAIPVQLFPIPVHSSRARFSSSYAVN